jgi:hypothetical protein
MGDDPRYDEHGEFIPLMENVIIAFKSNSFHSLQSAKHCEDLVKYPGWITAEFIKRADAVREAWGALVLKLQRAAPEVPASANGSQQ